MKAYLIFILLLSFHARAGIQDDINSMTLGPYKNDRVSNLEPSFTNCEETEFRIFAADPLRANASMRVTYKIYRPLIRSRKDSILIYPPTGGSTNIDSAFAEKFCKAGFTSMILISWPGSQLQGIVDPKVYDEMTIRGYHATLHAIDILGTKVGVFGMSLGGISAIAAGIFIPDKVKAVSAVVAGLPFYKIIARSEEEGMKANREHRIKRFGFYGIEDYEKFLKKKIKIEPLNYLVHPNITPHQFVLADDDEMVSTDIQVRTMEKFSHSESVTYTGGHIPTILRAYMYRKNETLEFFERFLQ